MGLNPNIDRCAVSDPQAKPGSTGSNIPKKPFFDEIKYLDKFGVKIALKMSSW